MRRIFSLALPMALAACCVSLAGTSEVSAQPARGGAVVLGQGSGASAEEQAKVHFDAAREHYANGRYREAIDELELALTIDPNGADLVYNLGVINEKLQEVDAAILHYKRYVDMIDDAEEQERVNKIIQRLEKARDELAAQKEEDAAAAAAAASDDPARDDGSKQKGRMDGWVIGAGVLAGLGLAGGTYFGLQAMKNKNDDPPTTGPDTTYADLEDNADKAKQQAQFADIGFGVALVAGTTAAILYFARDAEDEVETATRPGRWEPGVAVLPGGAAASLRVGF